ncbi:MAG: hypothetical protein IAE97_00635 [Chthoniobacterales bacterium]|nr:hypothetical protein [Chthoniobacterales bacterium]
MARRARRPVAKPRRERLNTSFAAASEPVVVPVRWVKSVVGVFLLPPCYIVTASFFSALTHAAEKNVWFTPEFWFFGLGVVLWLIAYFGLPRPLLIYVFGHELTHALVVLLMGGRVSRFSVSRDGGHIISSKINTWIALAPYFIPIYSVIVIGLYGLGSCFYDLEPYRSLLYALIGVTWAFHATFTLSMIPRGQTDLTYGGTFFSLTVIYLMNLLLLSLLLIVATPYVSFRSFGGELQGHATAFASHAAWVFEVFARSLSGRS